MLPEREREGKNTEDQQKHQAFQSGLNQTQFYYKAEKRMIWYLASWGIFLLVFGIYMCIFAIDRYAGSAQQSYFYASGKGISPYILSSSEIQSGCQTSVVAESTTESIYTSTQRRTASAIALPILFTWLMWKLPLMIYTLDVIWVQQNKILRFVPWACALVVALAVDILLFIFIPSQYNDWYFFALSAFLSFILVLINNGKNRLAGLAAIFYPLGFIGFLYACYAYFFPALFLVYRNNVPEASLYIQVYLFPLWDLLLYAFYLTMNAHITKLSQKFLSYVNFLMLGYFAGITMLIGITEVEFYYLLAYLLFRNFFVNWVMWRWDHIVNLPAVLPGWIFIFYMSNFLNFVPVNGIGQLTISKGYFSEQFNQACLLLYYIPSSLYSFANPTNTAMGNPFNYGLVGYIFWASALLIWGVSTFTQRYPRTKPSGFDFFYMFIGIYMFYVGISAAVQIWPLSEVAMQ